MEANLNFKNIERRIKELAKDYESKGYAVIINPSQALLPDFLKGFEPDLIVKNSEESVIIEVKSRQDINELKKYEQFASEISERKGWRFELVFTNMQVPFIDKNSDITLDKVTIKSRLQQINSIIANNLFEAAFLLTWATLEGAMRLQLDNENIQISNKQTSYIFKTLYSYGLINQNDYRNLEKLFLIRNNLIHGFHQHIERKDIDDLINLIIYLIGEDIKSKMQEWLENLDLDYYDDIHSLYLTVHGKENYGAFNYEETNGKIIIGSDDNDDKLILNSDGERKRFADLIEEEYMEGMSPDGWYGYHRAMEKDD